METYGPGGGTIARTYKYYPGTDAPASVQMNGQILYYALDASGNVQGLLNSSGAVVNQYSYDPFGALLSSSETFTNMVRFKSRYYDSETGLYENRARYYDPQGQRFISEDPIGLDGGINLYAFAHNDPVNSSDPSGLQEPCVFGLRGGTYELLCSQHSPEEILRMFGFMKPLGFGMITSGPSVMYGGGPILPPTAPMPSGIGGGATGTSNQAAANKRTMNQCFNENTEPARQALKAGLGQFMVVAATVAGAGAVIRGQGLNLVRQAFASGSAQSFLWREGVSASVVGSRYVAGGAAVLEVGGVAFAAAFVGLGAYATTSALICAVNPDYGN